MDTESSWIEADGGYALALDGDTLLCRNNKGKVLASVPAKVKQGEAAQQLLAVRDWLRSHRLECAETVETWLLRSLPVPREAIAAVWSDPAWRAVLVNAVTTPVDDEGRPDQERSGFLRDVADGRLGVVDLDGESVWLDDPQVALLSPILLDELQDWRELATELGLEQGLPQLFRETWEKPGELAEGARSVSDFEDGKFEQLNYALGRCRSLGYRVRGGFATCPVWEGGRVVEARYWIGADYPEGETWTGELLWVDARERTIPLSEVGPVAYSEGMRMASRIFAGRKVDKEEAS